MSRGLWALLGRSPRRAGSGVLGSQQPDESHTARFARPNACHSSAGRPGNRSRHYCAEGRALVAALTRAASRAGGRSPARSAGRPHSGARCRTTSRLAACSHACARDALRSAGRRAGATTSACCCAAHRSACAAASARTGDAGSPLRAQEPRAIGRGVAGSCVGAPSRLIAARSSSTTRLVQLLRTRTKILAGGSVSRICPASRPIATTGKTQ
jgi:hypothetical protein